MGRAPACPLQRDRPCQAMPVPVLKLEPCCLATATTVLLKAPALQTVSVLQTEIHPETA